MTTITHAANRRNKARSIATLPIMTYIVVELSEPPPRPPLEPALGTEGLLSESGVVEVTIGMVVVWGVCSVPVVTSMPVEHGVA